MIGESRARNEIDAVKQANSAYKWIIGGLIVLCLYQTYGWSKAPDKIQLHYPPDLRSGAVMGIREINPAEIYTFALMIFQQLNAWHKDGSKEYKNRIESLRCYLTPKFYSDRLDDYNKRIKSYELADRTRAVFEIPDHFYTEKRIKPISVESWVGYLDLLVEETHSATGERIKSAFVRYPLLVVRDNSDSECNAFGLKLAGFESAPESLDAPADEQLNTGVAK